MNKGCYFSIDDSVPEEERCFTVHCSDCHDNHFPELGWYWPDVKGYGPYDIICDNCGKIIHQNGKNKDIKSGEMSRE